MSSPVLSPLQAIVDVDTVVRRGLRPLDVARAMFDGGATFLQVRAKTLPSEALLHLCDEVVRTGREYGALVIVNDRVDLALLSGAAGAHVGQDDLPPVAARMQLGPSAIIGYSTHTIDQVREAVRWPVTYIAVGPVFGTHSKDTGYAAVGLELVAQAAAVAGPIPIVAIGGITLATAPAVLAAGARAVAVIGDLMVGELSVRTADYVRRLGQYRV